jgi:hypothetical protein
MLALSLLRRQRRRRLAASRAAGENNRQKRCTNVIQISTLNSGDLGDCSRTSCLRTLSLSGRANSGQAAQYVLG